MQDITSHTCHMTQVSPNSHLLTVKDTDSDLSYQRLLVGSVRDAEQIRSHRHMSFSLIKALYVSK